MRSLFSLGDAALANVVRGKMLEALQFDTMSDRHDNIESAYSTTFEWLLGELIDPNGYLRARAHKGSGRDIRHTTGIETKTYPEEQRNKA
jgi:hypothetical protein